MRASFHLGPVYATECKQLSKFLCLLWLDNLLDMIDKSRAFVSETVKHHRAFLATNNFWKEKIRLKKALSILILREQAAQNKYSKNY